MYDIFSAQQAGGGNEREVDFLMAEGQFQAGSDSISPALKDKT